MNRSPFDALVRLALSSRRSLLGGGLALVALRRGIAATEAKKHKGKKRKGKQRAAEPNAFGCIDVGDACQRAAQCCSGICAGKKGKRRCQAHDTGTCLQGQPGYCESGIPISCNNTATCLCFRTTAGSKFCGDVLVDAGGDCAACTKDADCAALGFPPGSACVPATSGGCSGQCESGMFCLPPCGTDSTEE